MATPLPPKGHRIERVDTIAITHGHFDHIHDAIPLAARFGPEVVGIYENLRLVGAQRSQEHARHEQGWKPEIPAA